LTLQLNGKALLRFVLQRQTYIHKMKVWIIKNKNNISFRIRDKQLHDSETKTNPFSLTERLKAARASPGLPSLLLSISLA
jgi:hypothetical protein